MNTIKAFWANVSIKGPNDCWIWSGKPDAGGYGRMMYHSKRKQAHILAFEFNGGKLSKRKPCVCHTCDVKLCCNPRHLFAGSKTDNNRDRHNKGRTCRGDAHGNTKVPDSLVMRLRIRYSIQKHKKQLFRGCQQLWAIEFGMSSATMSRIIRQTRGTNI